MPFRVVFRSFVHYTQRILAAVHGLALVLGKLLPKAFWCVGRSLMGVEWNIEICSAMGADANGRYGSEPFNHPKIALLHAISVRHGRIAWLSPVDAKWHHYTTAPSGKVSRHNLLDSVPIWENRPLIPRPPALLASTPAPASARRSGRALIFPTSAACSEGSTLAPGPLSPPAG